MKPDDWTVREKPYDLRERLLLYACLIVRVVKYLQTRGPIAVALSQQVLKCGTSAGANYEEADSGSSPKDTLAKRKIALRELKESAFRLRVLRHAGFLTAAHDPVIDETQELTLILGRIIRNSETPKSKPQTSTF